MPRMSKTRKRRPRVDPMKSTDLTLEECLNPEPRKRKSRRRSTAASTENEAAHKRLLVRAKKSDESERGKLRGTFIPKWLLRVVPNSTEALVLAQIVYWTDKSGHKPEPNRDLNLTWVPVPYQEPSPERAAAMSETLRELESQYPHIEARAANA